VSVLHALGILGQDRDEAYEFLKQGTEFGTWGRIRKWKAQDGRLEDGVDGMFLGISIQALGLTGRPEVSALLRSLKEQNPRWTSKRGGVTTFEGDLCDAACNYDLYGKLGKQRFRELVYGPEYGGTLTDEWGKSSDGREWLRWAYPGLEPYDPLTSSTPLDSGGRSASAALLDHDAVNRDIGKEAGAQADTGVDDGATTNRLPTDSDGDGLPDYAEDRNGNNLVDPGETSAHDPDTDYDGRSDGQELAEGTDPLDSDSATKTRLGWWRFNSTGWPGEAGQGVPGSLLEDPSVGRARLLPSRDGSNLATVFDGSAGASPYRGQRSRIRPKAFANVQAVASWSGTALQVNSASPANLKYRDVEADGTANINCRKGSIRFWFKPGWSSDSGPGGWGRLIELGDNTPAGGWWALSVNPTGSELWLQSQLNGVQQTYLVGSLNLVASEWYQIVATYSTAASALYVNGACVATGSGIVNYPSVAARRLYGFSLGSNRDGIEQGKGQFEELETFNYALSPEQVAATYGAFCSPGIPTVTVEEEYVRSPEVALRVQALGGATAAMAVLVNSDDFPTAQWGPFQPNLVVTLGPADGIYEVWVGFKGLSPGAESWDMTRLVLDRVAPVARGIRPANRSTLRTLELDLTGYAAEELDSVEYDVYNAEGELLRQNASTEDADFDEEAFVYRRTEFDCESILLAEGTNTVVLRLTDLAGNESVRTLRYTVDLSDRATVPPRPQLR